MLLGLRCSNRQKNSTGVSLSRNHDVVIQNNPQSLFWTVSWIEFLHAEGSCIYWWTRGQLTSFKFTSSAVMSISLPSMSRCTLPPVWQGSLKKKEGSLRHSITFRARLWQHIHVTWLLMKESLQKMKEEHTSESMFSTDSPCKCKPLPTPASLVGPASCVYDIISPVNHMI